MNHKRKIKFLSVILSLLVIFSNISNISCSEEISGKISSSAKYNRKKSGTSQSLFMKFIKYTGIFAGISAAIYLTYYFGGLVLNYINSSDKTKSQEFDCKLDSDTNTLKIFINTDNNVRNTAFGIAGVGSIALFLINTCRNIVNSLGEFSKNIFNISQLRWATGNFFNMYKETSELFKSAPVEASKQEILERFDTLFEGFYGQKEAISALKSHIFDIAVAKDQARLSGNKYSRGDLFYLYGPSGVGKSFIAKRLPFVLLNSGSPLIISSADINKEKKESVVDQLFTSNTKNSEIISPTKPLIKYLKNNPKGVIIFEEYDKICTPALDEVLRTIIDQGYVNIDGEKVDCSGTVFIITSNEDDVSINGLYDDTNSKLNIKDIEKGYTRIQHNKSFLNRIKKVKFSDLSALEYSYIIKNRLDVIKSYWNNVDNGNIEISLDENTIIKLSEEIERMHQGARPIDLWIIPEIQIAIGNKIKNAPSYDFYANKRLDITYNNSNKTFSII